MFVMLLWECIHIASSIKLPVHSVDGTCNLWSANCATVQGQVRTKHSSLEYIDVEGTKHSFQVSNQLDVKAHMQCIGLVIQRMGVRFPLWSCKPFSFSSVLCTCTLRVLLTSQTSYSPHLSAHQFILSCTKKVHIYSCSRHHSLRTLLFSKKDLFIFKTNQLYWILIMNRKSQKPALWIFLLTYIFPCRCWFQWKISIHLLNITSFLHSLYFMNGSFPINYVIVSHLGIVCDGTLCKTNIKSVRSGCVQKTENLNKNILHCCYNFHTKGLHS